MPAFVAEALRADGWWLRSEIVWAKPNPMPESVTDRPSSAHEKIYLLTKKPKYFYDAEAVRRPPNSGPSDLKKMAEQKDRIGGKNKDTNIGQKRGVGSPDGASLRNVWDAEPEPNTHPRRKDGSYTLAKGHDPNDRRGSERTPKDVDGRSARMGREPGWREKQDKQRGHGRRHEGFNDRWDQMSKEEQKAAGANLRNVWRIATEPFRGAHFATFPKTLAKTCIEAGTSEKGVCSECGAPWKRVVDVSGGVKGKSWHDHEDDQGGGQSQTKPRGLSGDDVGNGPYRRRSLGWKPGCNCDAGIVPATVLDLFGGSGTVGLIADRLHRDAILIEISPEYAELARKRITDDAPMLVDVRME